MSVRTRKTQCVEPGGVKTALVPTAVSWTASLASTWPQPETASVSRMGGGIEEGGLRKAEDIWLSMHPTRNIFSCGYRLSSCLYIFHTVKLTQKLKKNVWSKFSCAGPGVCVWGCLFCFVLFANLSVNIPSTQASMHTLYPSLHHPTDIDECANDTVCGNHGFCDNTDGSFRCLCDQGFETSPSGWECVGEKPVGYPRSGLGKAVGPFSFLPISFLKGTDRVLFQTLMFTRLHDRTPKGGQGKLKGGRIPLQLVLLLGW